MVPRRKYLQLFFFFPLKKDILKSMTWVLKTLENEQSSQFMEWKKNLEEGMTALLIFKNNF